MQQPLSRFIDVLRAESHEARNRPVIAATLALAFASLLFVAVPRLDIAVTALFYDPAGGFLDRRYDIVEIVRVAGRLLEWAFALGVLLPLLVKLLFPAVPLALKPRATLFVLASLAIGPGLIVNGILKAFWGRARPREILEFGGDATFSPVWWVSDQCGRNCSFVSGEGAAAFWLMALVFIVPPAWKRPTAVAVLATAALVSLTRIAAGGHFLSDVLIAWLLVLIVLVVLRRYILEGLPAGFDVAVEEKAATGGRRLRQAFGSRGA